MSVRVSLVRAGPLRRLWCAEPFQAFVWWQMVPRRAEHKLDELGVEAGWVLDVPADCWAYQEGRTSGGVLVIRLVLCTGDLDNPPVAGFQAVRLGENLMRLDALPQVPEPMEPEGEQPDAWMEPPLVEEPVDDPVLEPGPEPVPVGGVVRALLVVERGCPNLIVRPSSGEELKLTIVSRGLEWFGRLEELLLDDVE